MGHEGGEGENTVDRCVCVSRKEVGKRKGGFTCKDMLSDRKRKDGYRLEASA